METKKVAVVIGTRPEAIKMAPVILALQKEPEFHVIVCSSGQHGLLVNEVFRVFGVHSYEDLKISSEKRSLVEYHQALFPAMVAYFEREKPDIVLVHGDTATAYCASISSFYLEIPIFHVEAGLRTYNMHEPYPEEMHRQGIDSMSSLCFAPTEDAASKLISEGKKKETVVVTGNTVIDALAYTENSSIIDSSIQAWVNASQAPILLVTAHRRENWGEPLEKMMMAVNEITQRYPSYRVIIPVNPNPVVKRTVEECLEKNPQVKMVKPMDVATFHFVLRKCFAVLSDSGGLQEEAPALGKPVLVMRRVTERQEGIRSGSLLLVGTEKEEIVSSFTLLVTNTELYRQMSQISYPFGLPGASDMIVRSMKAYVSR